MDITVRVEVQYVAPARARVRDVLHMFRTPAWVRFMVRYISPHLKNAAPADKSVLDSLSSWHAASDHTTNNSNSNSDDDKDGDCQCVICMSELAPREDSEAVRLPCGHAFHQPCIRSWLERRSTCPSCRFQFRKAFAGSYAVRTLNSALLLEPEHRALARDAVLAERVGGRTVRAVVHVTLSPVPVDARQQQYPCVLNALMMHANGDRFQDAPVDKADAEAPAAAAAAGPSTRSRVRRASDLEGFAHEDGSAKRLRVA